MQFERAYHISADRDAVWTALNDTSVLAKTIPGCKSINWTSDATLEAVIEANFGVIKPRFTGVLELSNIVPAQSYTLVGNGKGGIFGKAEGNADVVLTDHDGGTKLRFVAGGAASGQLQKLGGALLSAGANRVVDGFFARFGDAMQAQITPLHTD